MLKPTHLVFSAPPAQDDPSQTTSLPKLCARRFHIFPNYPPPAKEIYVCKQHCLLVFLQINRPHDNEQPVASMLHLSGHPACFIVRQSMLTPATFIQGAGQTVTDQRGKGHAKKQRRPEFPESFVFESTTSLLPETPPNQNQ